MAISDRILMKMPKARLKLSDLNPHLMCVLCGGYYIDATTIVECLHSFCRSCIVKHLEGSKYCPICEVQVHKTKPLINIRPDKTLQDIVYKLVPGLFANEMNNRRVFYQERPHYIKPNDSESVGEISNERAKMFGDGENVTFSLSYLLGPSPVPVDDKYKEVNHIQSGLRYFRCPLGVSIHHLKKLLKAKYELRGNNYKINIFFKDTNLSDDYTLLDISYIFLWVNKIIHKGKHLEGCRKSVSGELLIARVMAEMKQEENLSMTFKVYECPTKGRRRRYAGGSNEQSVNHTPLSILQSRLGQLIDSLGEDAMLEGRRHLRSDVAKKKREIELKMEEERRMSERELRSHVVKKKDKSKGYKSRGVKKKEKKKEGKHGEDKKKNPDEKKKKKDKDEEGKCQEEKRKEKDDKGDKEEKRKDKEAKVEKKDTKKEGDHKRKREGERDEKRKREKLDDAKEKSLDKGEEVEEKVCEKTMSGEETTATASEPAPTEEVSASISAVDTDSVSVSASALASTSTFKPISEENSEQALEKDFKPVSTTEDVATETEETPGLSEFIFSQEERADSPKESENTDAQLDMSEPELVDLSSVDESSENVAESVEETTCVRVTRRSSITSPLTRDETTGIRLMKKRGPKPKKDLTQNDDGSAKNSALKVNPKTPSFFRTIRRSPVLWHPTISREKLRSHYLKNSEEPQRPPKFFKLRNRQRVLENSMSDTKPTAGEPATGEEEMKHHESEKEQAQGEQQKASAATSNEGDESKFKQEKGRLQDGSNVVETTSTSRGHRRTLETVEDKNSNKVEASAHDLPTNVNGGQNTYESSKRESRSSNLVGSSSSNLLTNPFIPNSNHFLFSNVTHPPNSGNLSKSAELSQKTGEKTGQEKEETGGVKPGSGSGSESGSGSGSERGSGQYKTQNGVNRISSDCSPMCFLDPCRLVLPYHAYPLRERDSFIQPNRLSAFGNMTLYNPVGGLEGGLKHSLTSHHNHGSGKKNKDDSTKEKNKDDDIKEKNKDDNAKEKNQSPDDALNSSRTEDKERKKRRRRVETETTNFLRTRAASRESKADADANAGGDDEGAAIVPAKRKRDEKGSRDKEKKEEVGGKKDKLKDDKGEREKEKEKGDKRKDDW